MEAIYAGRVAFRKEKISAISHKGAMTVKTSQIIKNPELLSYQILTVDNLADLALLTGVPDEYYDENPSKSKTPPINAFIDAFKDMGSQFSWEDLSGTQIKLACATLNAFLHGNSKSVAVEGVEDLLNRIYFPMHIRSYGGYDDTLIVDRDMEFGNGTDHSVFTWKEIQFCGGHLTLLGQTDMLSTTVTINSNNETPETPLITTTVIPTPPGGAGGNGASAPDAPESDAEYGIKGGAGAPGGNGGDGSNGANSKDNTMTFDQILDGVLTVAITGSNGGAGGIPGNGGKGGNGGNSTHKSGHGGDGGAGGAGGTGGTGGAGGNGGTTTITLKCAISRIEVIPSGAAGGAGAAGGTGGVGGAGGSGSSSNGAPGSTGASGVKGKAGAAGNTGSIIIIPG